ncbi:MAG TPA: signal peptidase I [Allosphingosinicella sp.]|nr:signal peptidase I [Allosphingosinicella sp.]
MSPASRRVIWGTIVGIAAVIGLMVVALVGVFGSGYVRHFHLPSEAMAPTFEKGDRFVASMDGGGDLKRGNVILLAVGETTYVKRIAALPGDRIAMNGGLVILNGRPIPQRFLAEERRPEMAGAPPARRLAEQLPGEAAPHEILDMGPSEVDEFPELRVPAGFVFVLGDNRDRSADSRVSRVSMGVDLLPVGDVKGRPLFCTKGCKLGR